MTIPTPRHASDNPAALTIDEFSGRYRVGRTLIYQELKEGRLRAVKLGKRTLIRREDADAWLASLAPFKPWRPTA